MYKTEQAIRKREKAYVIDQLKELGVKDKDILGKTYRELVHKLAVERLIVARKVNIETEINKYF